MDARQLLGLRVKAIRTQLGLSQEELAFRCGMHASHIGFLDSVYLRSSQNSQPNSDASDVNSRKERGRVFRIARSDPPPAF